MIVSSVSLSLSLSLGGVGVVWWCTEISGARREIVSGALQVLTQHAFTDTIPLPLPDKKYIWCQKQKERHATDNYAAERRKD